MLLNSNESRQILGKTLKFLPALGKLKPVYVARDFDKFHTRLTKTFNWIIHDFISQAKANSALISDSQSLNGNQWNFLTLLTVMLGIFQKGSRPLGSVWKNHKVICPYLAKFSLSLETDAVKVAAGMNKPTVCVRFNREDFIAKTTIKLELTIQTKIMVLFCTVVTYISNNAFCCCMTRKVYTFILQA